MNNFTQTELEGYLDEALAAETMTRIEAALRDDRGFFHASNLAPVVRTPVLQHYPELEVHLSELSRKLDQRTLTSLRRQVILEGRKPQTVARRFLGDSGLLSTLKAVLSRERGG